MLGREKMSAAIRDVADQADGLIKITLAVSLIALVVACTALVIARKAKLCR